MAAEVAAFQTQGQSVVARNAAEAARVHVAVLTVQTVGGRSRVRPDAGAVEICGAETQSIQVLDRVEIRAARAVVFDGSNRACEQLMLERGAPQMRICGGNVLPYITKAGNRQDFR